ncbi:ribosomal large subunit pseudouridine synthase B [Methylophilus rhizosphaerae]|uniref:Pseudouridine synthase n=1 Tax=Methylophilus rhizosphaerae TaxID=492660 RepID=A0A1G8ZSF2_9PROT|nr:pseudouridine synthase [Methylophilus rhizosphaerae]SDK17988.1 ribosomal large subunit pseudouridine synthase B [Methylophilus rhizosphaerae]
MARPFKTPKTASPIRPPRPAKVRTPEAADHVEGAETPAESRSGQRLHKLLALAGFGSRRDMETLVASGRITVNGQVAQVGAVVDEYDIVRLDSRILHLPFEAELPQILLYHKPEGEIVSQDDPEGRATVFDKLPRIKQGKWLAIGRLDMNTSGLLIFTNSGELANRFMHPRYEVEREYAVRILGELTEDQMAQLKHGIELEDGPANFESIFAQGGEGANKWYQVVIKEGRNREVRRLFEAFHLPVSRLMRVRFGPINLPPRLKRGTMLKLEQKQVVGLLEWAGLPVPRKPLKQLSPREKDHATRVFVPKVRKQRRSLLETANATADTERPARPAPKQSRRIRQDADLKQASRENARMNSGAKKRSDRNRGRG